MTPTGINYDQITERNICVLDAEGVLLDGDGARSSEWPMHRRIYDLTDAVAVAHTHSPFAVAMSTVCDELPAVHYAVLRLGGPTVRVAPYTTFGSDGLAGVAAEALDGRFAALLQNHGAVVYGTRSTRPTTGRCCSNGSPRCTGGPGWPARRASSATPS